MKIKITPLENAIHITDSNVRQYKTKGGMKLPINPNTPLCKNTKTSGIDCALNVIDTLTGNIFREKWKYRVNTYYPKSFNLEDGMETAIIINVLHKLLPDQFEGKELFFRDIEVNDSETVRDIISQYWDRIQQKPSTALKNNEGLVLCFSNNNDDAHIVVLAKLPHVSNPSIIDQQFEESPMELDRYYYEHAEKNNWDRIEILEDGEYSEEVGDFIGNLVQNSSPIGRLPSTEAYDEETIDDIDFQDEKTGNTALINATINNDLDAVRIFIIGGAKPYIKNKEGMTALAIACRDNYKKIAKFLVTSTEDVIVNIQDEHGNTPLHFACYNDNKTIVKMLVTDANADVNIQDKDGNTPLHLACNNDNKIIVKMLLTDANVNVNIQDKDGSTVLHWACRNGNEAIVKLIIDKLNPNVNIQDKDGNTPLHFACYWPQRRMVSMLVEGANANIDVQDKNGKTPLEIAKKYKYEEIIKILTKHTSKGGRTKKQRRTKKHRKAKKNITGRKNRILYK
jgi:ankyrin repeat protein